MSLCPTRQCNALCNFCSVTINRTGIVKRQLSQDLLERFLAPVAGTIRMYGLEGNGEPTLHPRFEELVERFTAGVAQAYLITNASRLSEDRLPLLLALESVNVSLNAATAGTHRKVMKLKDFKAVCDAISGLVRLRGVSSGAWKPGPRISVSFVTTADNIHEAQDFLHLAEERLGVDEALIRPLSELGNDLGAVEDLRNIVPYESDVRDMLDAIEDYLSDRRSCLEVKVAPETFRSVRPDPVGGVLMPRSYEERLLAPRRRAWTAMSDRLRVRWDLNRVELSMDDGVLGPVWQSHLIPVVPGKALRFRCALSLDGGPVTVSVVDEAGSDLAREVVTDTTGEVRHLDLDFEVGSGEAVRLVFSGGGRAFRADIDFERLRTPAPYVHGDFRLPRPARWEKGVEGVEFVWESDSTLRLRWSGAAGPYLAKSYTIPCAKGRRMDVPATVHVASGRLGVGILDGTFSNWIMTTEFETGERDAVLSFDVGENERVQVVLYSAAEVPLDARIDWHELRSDASGRQPAAMAAMVPDEAVSGAGAPAVSSDLGAPATQAPPVAEAERPAAPRTLPPAEPPAKGEARLNRWRQTLAKALHGRREVYCHKPWTDLHNFTVDGRMDVCCIATGPSQERYAWGNLKVQTFQEVWNGATAREFRRTVNSAKPLPPCARCPMSHAYQGMWFDPEATMHGLQRRLWNSRIAKLPGGRFLVPLAYASLRLIMHGLVFRGFRRRPLFGKGG
jgi:MoaA/NifB/PqqE/SkfB family radical SAM enzyme